MSTNISAVVSRSHITPFYEDVIKNLKANGFTLDVFQLENFNTKRPLASRLLLLYSAAIDTEPSLLEDALPRKYDYFLLLFDFFRKDHPATSQEEEIEMYKQYKEKYGQFIPPPDRVIFFVDRLREDQTKKLMEFITKLEVKIL